ncbi:MAG: hypothetical protein V1660_02605 [archaeon]
MTEEEKYELTFPVSKDGLEKVMQELAKEGTATVNKISKINTVTYRCPILNEYLKVNENHSKNYDAIIHFEGDKAKKIICPLYDISNSKCTETRFIQNYTHSKLNNLGDKCLAESK